MSLSSNKAISKNLVRNC